MRNIYGDGNALFRTSALRAIGGFTTDRDTSFEDWEVFVRLINAGYAMDVLPEPLFYYRHRDASFSRVTNDYSNHHRVLRQYVEAENLPRSDGLALWNYLTGLQHRVDELELANRRLGAQLSSPRHRLMDKVHGLVKRIPFVPSTMRWLLQRWGGRPTE